MKQTAKIYKKILMDGLEQLANRQRQEFTWSPNSQNIMSSFTEDVIAVFDDAIVMHALQNGHIIFDKNVTKALWELHDATDAVDERRPPEEVINDPKMELVRQKATEILRLINISDMSQNTVEFIEPGQPAGG